MKKKLLSLLVAVTMIFSCLPFASLSAAAAEVDGNLKRTVQTAQQVVKGFNACTTDAERRTYLGISNNNISNDSFRAVYGRLTGDAALQLQDAGLLESEEVQTALQTARATALYLQPYFLKDENGKRTFVLYASLTSSISKRDWNAYLLYLPAGQDGLSGSWYVTNKAHRKAVNVANFNGKSFADVQNKEAQNAEHWILIADQSAAREPKVADPYEAIRFLAGQLATEGSVAEGYFSTRGQGASLDGRGKNFAPDINAALAAAGVTDEDSTYAWRIYKCKESVGEHGYNIFWTNSNLDDGGRFPCLKYNTATSEWVEGTATARQTTVEGTTFLIIDGGSFVPNETQPDTAVKYTLS